ncbi:MAG: ATP-binding protein [Clostridiaceae bacterium]|nr:ATP-binding protein [Clostridiaceae bacterium]
MIYKGFEHIGLDDINQLKTNEIPEGKSIEYKLSLPGGNDQEKKEFLADISSFANTMGGDIFYGIDEENGTPKEIVGIELSDIDSEIRRLDSFIRDGIEPRISTSIKSITLENSKSIIFIRIQRSWNNPHRVIYKGHDKFYARNSAGKYPLDTFELREAFTSSQIIEEKIKRFRNERIQALSYNETPIPFDEGAKCVLHIIPIDAFNRSVSYDISGEHNISNLRPIRGAGWNNRINLEGLLTYSGGNTTSYSYVQLYRNGIIEAVNNSMLSFYEEEKLIPSLGYEEALIESLNSYINVLKSLSVTVPLFCFLSLIGVKGYTLGLSAGFSFVDKYSIDKENIILPETIIENYDIRPERILKPSFDLVWNACGLERSYNFDQNGNWCPKR